MEAGATPTPGVQIPGLPEVTIPDVPRILGVPGIPGVATGLFVDLIALLLGLAVVFLIIGLVWRLVAGRGPKAQDVGEARRQRYEGREARIGEQARAVQQGLAAAYAAGDLDDLLDDLAERVATKLAKSLPAKPAGEGPGTRERAGEPRPSTGRRWPLSR